MAFPFLHPFFSNQQVVPGPWPGQVTKTFMRKWRRPRFTRCRHVVHISRGWPICCFGEVRKGGREKERKGGGGEKEIAWRRGSEDPDGE